MTCNRGNISSSGKQPSGPVPFITAPVADLLALVAVQSVTEAVEWGRGVMSVVGDGSKRLHLHRSLRVVIQTALAKAPVRGARKDLVLGVNSPLVSVPLGDSDQAGLTVPAPEQDLVSPTRAQEVVGMAHSGPRAVMDVLNVEVQETIASARAPATRKLYSSKWGVFESWSLTRAIDPVNCPVGPVLEFLQERMTAGAAATTLRVYESWMRSPWGGIG